MDTIEATLLQHLLAIAGVRHGKASMNSCLFHLEYVVVDFVFKLLITALQL